MSGRRGRAGRGRLTERVRTARRRSPSSTRWLQRQLNDPVVAEAQRLGYRSRAALKLIELDDRLHLLKPGMRVLDLGAAPGGWTQVAVDRVRAGRPGGGRVLAVDIAETDPVPDADHMTIDFLDADAPSRIRACLSGPVDLMLSDMSPATTGHRPTDHLRIMALADAAFAFAREVLAPGGAFVTKLFQGGAEHDLLEAVKRDFAKVRHIKPPASRKDSSEIYLVATGFRGNTT